MPLDPLEARARVDRLRALIPAHVSIGVSGDWFGAIGLNAGCEVWYSAWGGLFPRTLLEITRTAQRGDVREASQLLERLRPLWDLVARQGGSLRVMAAAAELLGLAKSPCLPLPLKAIHGTDRERLAELIASLELQ
jgi:4-hydroxy-tetrahydrodipicolinate synthase